MSRTDFLLLLAASVTGVNPEEESRLRELEIMLHTDKLKIANGTNFSEEYFSPWVNFNNAKRFIFKNIFSEKSCAALLPNAGNI